MDIMWLSCLVCHCTILSKEGEDFMNVGEVIIAK